MRAGCVSLSLSLYGVKANNKDGRERDATHEVEATHRWKSIDLRATFIINTRFSSQEFDESRSASSTLLYSSLFQVTLYITATAM